MIQLYTDTDEVVDGMGSILPMVFGLYLCHVKMVMGKVL